MENTRARILTAAAQLFEQQVLTAWRFFNIYLTT